MIKIGHIAWLRQTKIREITDYSLPEIKAAVSASRIPYLVYRDNKYYRAVEVCEVFNVVNRCHACLAEVSESRTYCSEQCWVAAMSDDAREKGELLVGVPPVSVTISAHLMRKVREEADQMEMDLATAIRYLIDEGIEKQRRLPAL